MPQTSVPAPAKKGMSGLAWLGIGCGGVLVLAIIGVIAVFVLAKGKFEEFANNPEKAGAEMIVSLNPDLEMVSQDDGKGVMTIRTKDGKEMTLSYKDIAEGKIEMTDENGNVTTLGSTDLSNVPAWVPKVPDLSNGVSTFHGDAGGEITGQFSGKSGKSLQDLKDFFKSEATAQGLSNNSSSSRSLNGVGSCTLSFAGTGKTLKVVITEQPGSDTLVNVNYSEKK
jgi:hypothetical protein